MSLILPFVQHRRTLIMFPRRTFKQMFACSQQLPWHLCWQSKSWKNEEMLSCKRLLHLHTSWCRTSLHRKSLFPPHGIQSQILCSRKWLKLHCCGLFSHAESVHVFQRIFHGLKTATEGIWKTVCVCVSVCVGVGVAAWRLLARSVYNMTRLVSLTQTLSVLCYGPASPTQSCHFILCEVSLSEGSSDLFICVKEWQLVQEAPSHAQYPILQTCHDSPNDLWFQLDCS